MMTSTTSQYKGMTQPRTGTSANAAPTSAQVKAAENQHNDQLKEQAKSTYKTHMDTWSKYVPTAATILWTALALGILAVLIGVAAILLHFFNAVNKQNVDKFTSAANRGKVIQINSKTFDTIYFYLRENTLASTRWIEDDNLNPRTLNNSLYWYLTERNVSKMKDGSAMPDDLLAVIASGIQPGDYIQTTMKNRIYELDNTKGWYLREDLTNCITTASSPTGDLGNQRCLGFSIQPVAQQTAIPDSVIKPGVNVPFTPPPASTNPYTS
jgi:hypothetical protein